MPLFFESFINSYPPLKKYTLQGEKHRAKKSTQNKVKLEKAAEQRANFYKMPYPIKQIKWQKKIIHFLLFLSNTQIKLGGIKVKIINPYKKNTDEPIIFAGAHICKQDIQVLYGAVNEHALLLMGSSAIMNGTLEGWFLEQCGVNYVNRWDKKDRANSVKKMESDLMNGVNIIVFPEGAWNISENELIRPLTHSLPKLSLKTGAKIVPVGLERFDKTIYVNFGKAYMPNASDTPKESAFILRDKLATLKWEIIEQFPITKRQNIPDNYWQKCISEYIKEFPLVDMLEEESYIFKPKSDAYNFFEEFNSVIFYENGIKKIKRISSMGKLNNRFY